MAIRVAFPSLASPPPPGNGDDGLSGDGRISSSIVYPYREGEPFPASPFFMFFFKEAHHDQASR